MSSQMLNKIKTRNNFKYPNFKNLFISNCILKKKKKTQIVTVIMMLLVKIYTWSVGNCVQATFYNYEK